MFLRPCDSHVTLDILGLCDSLRCCRTDRRQMLAYVHPSEILELLLIHWIYIEYIAWHSHLQSRLLIVLHMSSSASSSQRQKKNRQSNPTWPYIFFGPVSDMLINCNTRIYHYLPWLRSISGCNRQLPWRYNWHIWHVDRLRLLLVPSLASLSGSLLRWWLRASCPMIKVSQSWRQDMAGHSLWPKFYDLYTSVWHCMANIGKSCNILTL